MIILLSSFVDIYLVSELDNEQKGRCYVDVDVDADVIILVEHYLLFGVGSYPDITI